MNYEKLELACIKLQYLLEIFEIHEEIIIEDIKTKNVNWCTKICYTYKEDKE